MKATCVKPASPLAENAFSPNQSGKLGKREGFKLSVARAKELGLYRQSYCGCEFSKKMP